MQVYRSRNIISRGRGYSDGVRGRAHAIPTLRRVLECGGVGEGDFGLSVPAVGRIDKCWIGVNSRKRDSCPQDEAEARRCRYDSHDACMCGQGQDDRDDEVNAGEIQGAYINLYGLNCSNWCYRYSVLARKLSAYSGMVLRTSYCDVSTEIWHAFWDCQEGALSPGTSVYFLETGDWMRGWHTGN